MKSKAPSPTGAADRKVEAAIARLNAGDPGGGERLLAEALQIEPRHTSALRVYGQLQRDRGRHGQAAAAYDAILAISPRDVDAHFGRALALLALNRAEDALPSLDLVAELFPDFARGHHTRGVALNCLGYLDEALLSFDQALLLEPDEVATINNRGATLHDLGRLREALQDFERTLRIDPDNVHALTNQGGLLRELGRPAEALASCRRAVELKPGDASALNNLGLALHAQGRLPEAEAAFRLLLSSRPDYVTALNNLADVLRDLGFANQALELYQRALQLAPEAVHSLGQSGLLLAELGREAEALAAFDRAIGLEPRRARTFYELSLVHAFSLDDPRLRAMEDLVMDPAGLSLGELVELNYALGRAYRSIGESELAFERFSEGAARKRALIGYSEAAELELLVDAARAFSAEAMRRGEGAGDPSEAPVFIVGMPCSGADLVERMLRERPGMAALAETPEFTQVLALPPEASPAELGPALSRAGAGYVARITAQAPGAARILSRVPADVRVLGLIHLALPRARFIHLRRDPRDACLAAFTTLFPREHLYSYDLGELGRRWIAEEALMEHWRTVLPPGVMLEVGYEDLLADPRSQARRILGHCGLDGDPAGAGIGPQDRGDVGAWRTYEPWLGPLIAALGD